MTEFDPLADLRAAGDEYQAVRATYEAARDRLHPLMVAALKEGVSPTEVVRLTGYTRDRVRVIARQNGIESQGDGRPKRQR